MATIYRITNRLDGKQYVGQTIQTSKRRFVLHKNQSRRGHGHYLHRAMRAHGEEHFELDVLEMCEVELLDEREIFWIAKLGTFGTGYNLNEGGRGNRGRRQSTTARAKMRERHWSKADKRDACIEKIKAANVGKLISDETRERIGESNRGKTRSIEQCEHYSTSKLGCKNPMYGKAPTTARQVSQFTLEGEFVANFPSSTAACRALGKKSPAAIRNCCDGKSASSYGFIWRH